MRRSPREDYQWCITSSVEIHRGATGSTDHDGDVMINKQQSPVMKTTEQSSWSVHLWLPLIMLSRCSLTELISVSSTTTASALLYYTLLHSFTADISCFMLPLASQVCQCSCAPSWKVQHGFESLWVSGAGTVLLDGRAQPL